MAGRLARSVRPDDHIYFRGGYIVIDRMGFRLHEEELRRRVHLDEVGRPTFRRATAVTPGLRVTAGVRGDRFDYIGETAVSPAAGLSYRPGQAD